MLWRSFKSTVMSVARPHHLKDLGKAGFWPFLRPVLSGRNTEDDLTQSWQGLIPKVDWRSNSLLKNQLPVSQCLLEHLPACSLSLGFPDSLVGKESTCNAGDPSSIPGLGRYFWRRDRLPTPVFLGFPYGSAGKESTCNLGDLGSIPGLGRSPEEGKGYPLRIRRVRHN